MSFLQKTVFSVFLLVCSLNALIRAEIDLEVLAQDFFLETKQVHIPNEPHAFNPSIIRWKGRWLMSFRIVNSDQHISPICSATESAIGLIYLDETLNPIGNPQFIFLDHPKKQRPHLIAEDARLIVKEDRLYVIYSANKEADIVDSGFRVYVAELDSDEKGFFALDNECLSQFPGMNENKREKNWVPFIYENELLLAYSIFPHKIFHAFLDGSETCESVVDSFPSLVWEWGELRGGTPAIKLNEDYYLGFFHSSTLLSTVHSNNEPIPHYFIGAYLFSSKPPFEIKYISPEPIIGPNFYYGLSYKPYWHPVRVVFPCGLVIDEDVIWIAYGRQDHEVWLAKLDKQKLLNNLIQVSTLVKKKFSH